MANMSLLYSCSELSINPIILKVLVSCDFNINAMHTLLPTAKYSVQAIERSDSDY